MFRVTIVVSLFVTVRELADPVVTQLAAESREDALHEVWKINK